MENYQLVLSKCENPQSVWFYLKKHANEPSAMCKTCLNIVNCKGGSTSGLRVQLKSVHKIELDKTPGLESKKDGKLLKKQHSYTTIIGLSNVINLSRHNTPKL